MNKTYQYHLGIAIAVITETETNSETVKILKDLRRFLDTMTFQVLANMVEEPDEFESQLVDIEIDPMTKEELEARLKKILGT